MTRSILPLMAAALLLAGCGDQVLGPGGTSNVSIRDNSFSPQTVIVPRGTTVRWTNDGAIVHTVVGDNNAWDSGDIEPGDRFSRLFSGFGEFPYRCTVHGEIGTVIVD